MRTASIVAGETNISRSRKPINRVRLVPRRVRPVREVLEALRDADLILVGPGSLYTSIIPNLLVEEIVDVIAHSRATRVYIANLMTQPGETQHYSVADHVRAIYHHTRPGLFDFVVVNSEPVTPRLLRRYREPGGRARRSLSGRTGAIRPSVYYRQTAAGRERRAPRSGAFDATADRQIC